MVRIWAYSEESVSNERALGVDDTGSDGTGMLSPIHECCFALALSESSPSEQHAVQYRGWVNDMERSNKNLQVY